MKRYLLIYKECIRVAFAQASTYRMNFILNSIIMLFGNILLPLVTLLIYGAGASFEGWTVYEVLLIQSIFTMSMAIADMTFHGILWATMGAVREGNFEMVLLMPVDTMFLLMARTFSIEATGLFIGGLTIFLVALSHIAAPTLIMWLQFLALFIIGLLVMMGTGLLMAATSFKWVGNSRIPEIFDSLRSFGKYPQSIFPKSIKMISAYIIPVAMIGFYPASALLGRTNIAMFLAIIPCFLFMLAGVALYRFMVRMYQGVGG
ncbi:ABC-2 family transporter protein [Lachnospiraceae bacterium MD1]|uniref:ABC-2 family transporter protein n=1 Tax=Variimorphobacter saccharofermentans TaxID=2755051 RepID=A0A839K5Q3_9FIRM|nr:ABC-2 family transporter protein [Variimorphobacter saccharofermentans]MBB2184678.1 ABC-2 family transporter protein [Variimorphobacter saccharofermentans]